MSSQNQRKIETLEGGQHIRLRWSMYLDADPEKALRLALRELWVNSCDDHVYRETRKPTVKIVLDRNKRTVFVQDNGGGIPKESVEAAFLIVNTGSNFHDREKSLAGAMGVGLKALSHTAKTMQVTTREQDNPKATELVIEDDGEKGIKKSLKECKAEKSFQGTTVEFVPLESVYGDAWIDYELLKAEIQEAARFYPEIEFCLTFADTKDSVVLRYPKGLKEENTEVFYQSDSLIISLALQKGDIKPYANRLHMPQGGAFYTHFKTQLTRAINDTVDFKISGPEIQAVLSGYIAVFVKDPVFSNQQKSAIGNKEVNVEISNAVKTIVKDLQASKNWQSLIKTLEVEVKADAAAERAREKVRAAKEKIAQGGKRKIIASDKLKDCIQEGQNAWLAISEGKTKI